MAAVYFRLREFRKSSSQSRGKCGKLSRVHDDALRSRLRRLEIETPSWAYGNSGTRFHVYPWPGAARDVRERIADAGLVHRLTGCCPTVALHIPWDRVDDWAELASYAESQGVRIGAINPNVFGDDAYRLGSLCNPDASVRRRALDHCLECIEIAGEVGSTVLSLWLADGTNYPGQDSLRGRYARLTASLEELYAALPDGLRLLVEYKFFEPGFYSTDLPDWGTAALICRRLGPQAQVLVDTGHHAQGTNVEQIVALLLAEGLLGGFHFNNRKYADDDLIVGAIDPFELFRIMREIALAETDPATSDTAAAVEFMIDQSHNIEGKVDAMIQSVMNIQTAYAKALLVDEAAVAAAQAEGDVLGAHRLLLEAFETDVRPLLAELRARAGRRGRPGRRVPRGRATPRASRRSAASPRSRARTSRSEHRSAHRALRHLHRRHGLSRGGARDRSGARAARARGRVSRRADLLRPDAREQRLPGRRARARAPVRRGVRRARGRRVALVVVRRQRARALSAAGPRGRRRAARAGGPRRSRRACSSCRSCSSGGSGSRTSARPSRTASPTTRPATRCA